MSSGLTEGFVDVGEAAAVAPGDIRVVEVGGRRICVAHLDDGRWGAIDDLCTHDGGTLSDGELVDDCLECPRHGSCFDPLTGAVLSPPADEPVRAYPVRVVDGRILVAAAPPAD